MDGQKPFCQRKLNVKIETNHCPKSIVNEPPEIPCTNHKTEKGKIVYLGEKTVKFGDVITAVASLFLITVLISYPLESMLISLLGLNLAPTIGALISVLLGGLLVGYIFAGKTDDVRREVLVKISVLFTVLMLFSIVLNNAVLGEYFTNWVQETYMESNPTASLTTFEMFLVGGLFIGSQMFMNAILLFVFSLIGLFAGAKLRR